MMAGAFVLADLQAVTLPKDVDTAFKAAASEMVGATYTLVLYCGHQIVTGINYMILCEQRLSDKDQTKHLVKMIINAFMGECEIVLVEQII